MGYNQPFKYEDSDNYQNEISELYSYSEECDFLANKNAFEEFMEDLGLPLIWKHMVPEQKLRAVNTLMTSLEVSCSSTRFKSCRALAYIIQGNFGDCLNFVDHLFNSEISTYMLYEQGLFSILVQLLVMESDVNSEAFIKKSSQVKESSFVQSTELRLILSMLFTITEVMYQSSNSTNVRVIELRNQFIFELMQPFKDELLIVILFKMLNNFCNSSAPYFPVKKITLLLWKLILITLGGSDTIRDLKNEKRKLVNLEPIPQDTVTITKDMRHFSPPSTSRSHFKLDRKSGNRKVFKQSAFDVSSLLLEGSDNPESEDRHETDASEFIDNESKSAREDTFKQDIFTHCDIIDNSLVEEKIVANHELPTKPSTNETQLPTRLDIDLNDSFVPVDQWNGDLIKEPGPCQRTSGYKGLPWSPKVRNADLIVHMNYLRKKYFGFSLDNDIETTSGFPDPVVEGIHVIKKYLYTSLSDMQFEHEQKLDKFPLTFKEIDPNYQDRPAEQLYRALLPNLPLYLIPLLKILLAASNSQNNMNIMYNEINFDAIQEGKVEEMKINIDAARHKSIIIKSVSAIILLLLKHYKVNHVYQFEYISQQLMFANIIPLILKILNQDINEYISMKTSIPVIDFPACVIGEQPELTPESLTYALLPTISWRNMFSCINLVRILNKIVKWKNSRIALLILYKSATNLANASNVKNAMFQVYVLKLLKLQLKYLGRQWKKSNMHLMSAIYQKVRHRFTDDWAFSSENEPKPLELQAEEYTLQTNIGKFHQRRYSDLIDFGCNGGNYGGSNHQTQQQQQQQQLLMSTLLGSQNFKSNNLCNNTSGESSLGSSEFSNSCQLTQHFQQNYSKWLDSEVFHRTIEWDLL